MEEKQLLGCIVILWLLSVVGQVVVSIVFMCYLLSAINASPNLWTLYIVLAVVSVANTFLAALFSMVKK